VEQVTYALHGVANFIGSQIAVARYTDDER
jgi:hypothetical protein